MRAVTCTAMPLRLDLERIILSDQGIASKPPKRPPRPIRELPLPQLPLEAGRDSTDFCVASLSRVDPDLGAVAGGGRTIEDRRAGDPTGRAGQPSAGHAASTPRESNMAGRNTTGLKKRVKTLAAEGDNRMFELAEAMAEWRATPKPPDGDRPTLDELVDLTKRSRRTICYLLKVWQMVDDHGIPRDRLVHIGWTKMAVLAENCEPEEVKDALDLAETYTAKELPDALKGRASKFKARTVKLRLTPRQYYQFAAVLLANGARRPKRGRGLSGKEKALMKALGR